VRLCPCARAGALRLLSDDPREAFARPELRLPMKCPFCGTDNREDRDTCYYCGKDISMLRLLVNKSRHHFNNGLEHAERGRFKDAAAELVNALDLDSGFTQARVVLGTIYAKMEEMEQARETWRGAICRDRHLERAFEYLENVDQVIEQKPMRKWLRISISALIALGVICTLMAVFAFSTPQAWSSLETASRDIIQAKYREAEARLGTVTQSGDESATQAARAMNRLLSGYLEGFVDRAREEIPRGEYARAQREIDTLLSVSTSRPNAIEAELSNLRRQQRTQISVEIDKLAREVEDVLEKGKAKQVAARVRTVMNHAPDADQRIKLEGMLAGLAARESGLPDAPSLEAVRERQRDLAEFVTNLEAADWVRAQSSLVNLLGGLDPDFREPVSRLAELAWAQRLARDDFPETGVIAASLVQELFAEARFDPIARAAELPVLRDGGATMRPPDGVGDPWFVAWFNQNEGRLTARTADQVLLTLARENLPDLSGPSHDYFAGLVAWASGDTFGAQTFLGELPTGSPYHTRLSELLSGS
jgi:tetratricopeptide (TPR) repeat protein